MDGGETGIRSLTSFERFVTYGFLVPTFAIFPTITVAHYPKLLKSGKNGRGLLAQEKFVSQPGFFVNFLASPFYQSEERQLTGKPRLSRQSSLRWVMGVPSGNSW